MNRFIWSVILTVIIAESFFLGAENWRQIDQWKLKESILGRHYFTLNDQNDDLIASFFKIPFLVISKDQISKFGAYGLGPSELINAYTHFLYKGDLAILEQPDKIKVFTKKSGNYIYKDTKWLSRGKYISIFKSGIFFDQKIILAGFEQNSNFDNNKIDYYRIKILNDSGKFLKYLLKDEAKGVEFYPIMQMNAFLVDSRHNSVFYLIENRLNVVEISSNMEITRQQVLEAPKFYKSMPSDFYSFIKDKSVFRANIEKWGTEYSAITKVSVDENYLIIQIRTCSTSTKKFAILFYNMNTFKLEKTIYTNDLLLSVKNGKFYCFNNGDPAWDQDGEGDSIINIYKIK